MFVLFKNTFLLKNMGPNCLEIVLFHQFSVRTVSEALWVKWLPSSSRTHPTRSSTIIGRNSAPFSTGRLTRSTVSGHYNTNIAYIGTNKSNSNAINLNNSIGNNNMRFKYHSWMLNLKSETPSDTSCQLVSQSVILEFH